MTQEDLLMFEGLPVCLSCFNDTMNRYVQKLVFFQSMGIVIEYRDYIQQEVNKFFNRSFPTLQEPKMKLSKKQRIKLFKDILPELSSTERKFVKGLLEGEEEELF